MDQARTVAKNIMGGDAEYDAVPWFWSDQYDLKLQMVGFSAGADQEVVRGDPDTGSFARFYLTEGVLTAVDAVNRPKEFMASKLLVAAKKAVDAGQLADEAVDIKSLV